MALDYTLEIYTTLHPREIFILLIDLLDIPQFDERDTSNDDELFVTGCERISLSVRALDTGEYMDHHEQDEMEKVFGFRPTRSITFRLAKAMEGDEDSHRLEGQSEQLMQRGVFEILTREPGDAVLLFNGESVVLQRLHGCLELNTEWGWSDEEIAALRPPPYRRRQISSPLL